MSRKSRGIGLILAVYERTSGQCGICGKPVAPTEATLDHVIPLTRGGTDGIENLQLAHISCNRRKHNLLPRELAAGIDVSEARRRSRAAGLRTAKANREAAHTRVDREKIGATEEVSITELRESCGWTQAALAHAVGVTPVTIWCWESGRHDPKPRELRRLALIFGLMSSDVIRLPTEAQHRPRTQPKEGE